MPTAHNYIIFIFVNLAFIAQILGMVYFRSAAEVQANWPEYRCNPPYWVYSTDISKDFNYCIQNTQLNMMGYLLQPVNYLITGLTSMGADLSQSINGIRQMFGYIRNALTSSITNVFAVFSNLLIEFQKIIIGIKDMMGKIVGVVVTILYVLDGSVKTMNSAWAGPSGQMVRSIGSCFHPETPIRLKTGKTVQMKNLDVGCELEDGSVVISVMRLANLDRSPLFRVTNVDQNEEVYVTGDHFLFDKTVNKWIQVRYSPLAICQHANIPNEFSCLITSTGS